MAWRVPHRVARLFDLAPKLVVAAALMSLATYLVSAIPRVWYPFDLDFVEDGMLMQSLRVARDQAVFLPPNAEFVPHVYMPLYTWLGGLLFKVVGPGFAPLRMLSLGATLSAALLILVIARRESGRRWLAIACAGLWLAGYRISDGWYELARVDALYVALSLGGAALTIYRKDSTLGLVASGLVLGLAFLAKQNAFVFALAAAVYLYSAVGRRVWIALFTFAIVTVLPIVVLDASSGGWFSVYVFGIAYASPIELPRLFDVFRFELFGSMSVLAASTLFASTVTLRLHRMATVASRPWLLFVALAVLASLLGRASVGGGSNNWMIGYAFMSLVPALVYRDVARRRWSVPFVSVLILMQMVLGAYNPIRFIPTEAMRAAGERFIERVASIEGDVLVLMHPYYAVLAGKQPSAQVAALWHARWRGRDPLPTDFVERIENRSYAALVSDESFFFELEPKLAALIAASYVRDQELSETDAPATLTGLIVRPQVIYVPKPRP